MIGTSCTLLLVLLIWAPTFERYFHVAAAATETCRPVKISGCDGVTRARYGGGGKSPGKATRTLERYLSLLKASGSPNDQLLRKIWCYQLAPPCDDYPQPPCQSLCTQTEGAFTSRHGPLIHREAVRRITKGVRCSTLPTNNCDSRFEENLQRQVNLTLGSKATKRSRSSVIIQQPRPHKDCRCKNASDSKVGRRNYLEKQYHYALEARYLAVEGIPGGAPKVIRISVEAVLKSARVKIDLASVTLWAETGCVCQQLKPGEVYLFLGYEDIVHKRLLFDDTCMAVHWKDKWRHYIKKWEERLKKSRKRSRNIRLKRRKQFTSRAETDRPRHRDGHHKTLAKEEAPPTT